jgi:hypothetical protein
MRMRGYLFWGIVLIILAGFLLLNQLGILPGDIWGYFWPTVIILLGFWLMAGVVFRKGRKLEETTLSIPMETAKRATIILEHGAGKLNVQSGTGVSEILSGKFGSEINSAIKLTGDHIQVKLHPYQQFWNWYPGEGLNWDVHLNGHIPMSLKIESGASSSDINLSDLKVQDLDIDTGASNLDLFLPSSAGNTHVEIDAGASSLTIHIPEKVAAKIVLKTGVSSISINANRFPLIGKYIYESPDYAAAENRIDMTINAGVGSITVE